MKAFHWFNDYGYIIGWLLWLWLVIHMMVIFGSRFGFGFVIMVIFGYRFGFGFGFGLTTYSSL